MEVHHHSHKPKNWKEYITEFIMLFAAVTLGFFAENYREHTIIEHRMQENYQSIVVDLLQDNVKIDSINKFANEKGTNLITLSHFLYAFKKKSITENQLIDSIQNMGSLPIYSTLFINNTTFKNMQSSGLLSYVSNKKLKEKLSYYYEVHFKQINDHNKLFDEVGMNYFDKFLAFNQGNGIRKIYATNKTASKLSQYENEFNNSKSYQNFLIQLSSTRNLLTSDDFLLQTNVYMTRYYAYQWVLKYVKESNNELIALLESERNH
jgi:hypothetical protein